VIDSKRSAWVTGVAAALVLSLATGFAARVQDADLGVLIVVVEPRGTGGLPQGPGSTVTVRSLAISAGPIIQNAGPDASNFRVRFEFPAGFRWGADEPDPTEGCTATPTTAECVPPAIVPVGGDLSWRWDAIAPGPGTYSLRAEVVATATTDPDASDNVTTITLVVAPAAPTSVASAVTIAPRRPRAGAVVTASARVTREGEPVVPTAVRCTGRIGTAAVRGSPRASLGRAACVYRTRAAHRGRMLRGTLTFNAGETRFVRRFTSLLR
jgi:hypothetical protein